MGTRAEVMRETDAGTAFCLTDMDLAVGAATVAGVAAILGFLSVP